MMPSLAWDAATVPADDRGLSYGDGLFETMRTSQGGVPLLEHHLQRLTRGCRRLGISAPDHDSLARRVLDAVPPGVDGIVKLILTRGSGGRGYRPPDICEPRILVNAHPLPGVPREWYARGVNVRMCTTRIGRNPATAGLKHLGRLEQVLASAELQPGEAEGLMLDEHDRVIEGTRCNLFLCRAGRLRTPRLDMSGVVGVMREVTRELAAQMSVECAEDEIGVNDLQQADEIFLTNAVLGILPVARVDSLEWCRQRGPVAQKLMQAASELGVEAWGP